MGVITAVPSPSFEVLKDTKPDDTSLPPFMVSTTRGFLPRSHPVVDLPSDFDALTSLLKRMPMVTASGEPGLLADGSLGSVLPELPELTAAVDKYASNLPLQNALYRDYSFLASAYLLEPCHQAFLRGESYGLGRQSLPRNIALPLARCAELSGFQPFMEYAGSYALYNYRLEEPEKGMHYDNLRLIRAFEKGLDQTSSEAGFVLIHVEMVKNSGPLVEGAVRALEACERDDRAEFDDGLLQSLEAIQKVNHVMERELSLFHLLHPQADLQKACGLNLSLPTMSLSGHSSWVSLRSQCFPTVSFTKAYLRSPSHSAANQAQMTAWYASSSISPPNSLTPSQIPLLDNLLQISMPPSPLTKILQDFRSYRPGNHRAFLSHVVERATALSLKTYALRAPSSALLFLKLLDQVRDFRFRHWCFTREYILRRTAHPVATGGSPIVTWLPNQLIAVMDAMTEVGDMWGDKLEGRAKGEVVEMMELVERQREGLRKEVEKWCADRGVA